MDRLNLITRNTEEIVTIDELKNLLNSTRKPTVYLGTAITGRPHIAYYTWVLKMADFVRAGLKVELLLADLHGALDNTPWDVLDKRYKYYRKIIPLMFKSIKVKPSHLQIIKGSDFQLKKEYIYDVLKMSTLVSVNDAKRAASEVVKFGDNPRLSGLIYPVMQALDEQYLNVNIQYGGLDQRKILMFARENLPKLGYKARIEIMTPLIPGLISGKMSASDPKSKIDLLDDPETVNIKIKNASCVEGDLNNGLLPFLKYVIMTIKQDNNELFKIIRDEKYGKNLQFKNYQEIETAFVNKKIHPLDLKNSLAHEINELLKPINKRKSSLQKLAIAAFANE